MRPKEWLLYAICVFLVIIRVDFWNWGKVSEPVFLGWLSSNELYQFFIWFVGLILVLWVFNSFWYDPDED